MFNREDEYLKATRDAQVHVVEEGRGINVKLILINMVLLVTLISLVFLYLKKDSNGISNEFSGQKVAVLGVSYTSSKSEFSDDELIGILNDVEVDKVVETPVAHNNANLYDAMSQLVDDSSVKSQSMYSDAISRELDDKHKFKGKVVVVKKGDTLSSLAEKYYGDAMAFHKILKNNKNISEQSNTLYVGEKINIAY